MTETDEHKMTLPVDNFDAMAARFTASLRFVADWKHNYLGAAYSTRIKAAIAFLKQEIAEIERHPEIGP